MRLELDFDYVSKKDLGECIDNNDYIKYFYRDSDENDLIDLELNDVIASYRVVCENVIKFESFADIENEGCVVLEIYFDGYRKGVFNKNTYIRFTKCKNVCCRQAYIVL